MGNENLKLIQEYHDKEKTKLCQQYHVDKFEIEQGQYKKWYFNGQICSIGNFKDGRWHGKRQRWWEEGRRWIIETHNFKKGIHGTEIEFKYGK